MIYFVQHEATALIKIGMTDNLKSRLWGLRNDYGELTLLGLLAGYYDTERALHRKFKSTRTVFPKPIKHDAGVTEWFTPSAELLAFIGKKTKLVTPIDLFTDMQSYGNIAYHPDGKKPMLASERKDMIRILELPPIEQLLAKQAHLITAHQQTEGKAA